MQHNHKRTTWNLILWPGSDILYSLEMIWKWKAIPCCNNCCISNADQFPTGHTEQMASWQHLIDSIQPVDDILMTDGNVRGLTDFTWWLLSSFFFLTVQSLYTRRDISILCSIFDDYCVLVPYVCEQSIERVWTWFQCKLLFCISREFLPPFSFLHSKFQFIIYFFIPSDEGEILLQWLAH